MECATGSKPLRQETPTMAMSLQALRMYNYLKAHRDSMTEERADGSIWAQVCTADINIQDISKVQNAGYLSALEKAGLYKKIDKYFGMVRLPGKTVSE
jgi:hypothetical protein